MRRLGADLGLELFTLRERRFLLPLPQPPPLFFGRDFLALFLEERFLLPPHPIDLLLLRLLFTGAPQEPPGLLRFFDRDLLLLLFPPLEALDFFRGLDRQ